MMNMREPRLETSSGEKEVIMTGGEMTEGGTGIMTQGAHEAMTRGITEEPEIREEISMVETTTIGTEKDTVPGGIPVLQGLKE